MLPIASVDGAMSGSHFSFQQGQRITVLFVPYVVLSAEALAIVWLAAAINRAYALFSHSDLLERLDWLEPPGCYQHLCGSFFYTQQKKL